MGAGGGVPGGAGGGGGLGGLGGGQGEGGGGGGGEGGEGGGDSGHGQWSEGAVQKAQCSQDLSPPPHPLTPQHEPCVL